MLAFNWFECQNFICLGINLLGSEPVMVEVAVVSYMKRSYLVFRILKLHFSRRLITVYVFLNQSILNMEHTLGAVPHSSCPHSTAELSVNTIKQRWNQP